MACISTSEKPILVFSRCCCFSLRTGVLIIASLEIIFSLALVLLHLALEAVSTRVQASSRANQPGLRKSQEIECNVLDTIYLDETIRAVLHCIVFVTVSSILIHGVRKNRIGWMKIWMWVRGVMLLDDTIDEISVTDRFIPFLFMFFILVPFSVAAILVVRSYIIKLSSNDSFVRLDEVQPEV